jgi:uncharacterized protein
MKKVDLDRELSDDEFAWLGARLARVVGGRIPSVEAFDGFMTALAVCPDLIKAGEYIPVIVSGKTKNGGLVFESQEEAERFHGLLFRHWNIITDELGRGDIRMPYLEEDAEGNIKGNDWAKGFLEGTHLRHDVFEPIAANAEKGGPFIALWCLAYEHSEDP